MTILYARKFLTLSAILLTMLSWSFDIEASADLELSPVRIAFNQEGFIDAHGRLIIPPHYNLVGVFGANGLVSVANGKRHCYLNDKGVTVIPCRFQHAGTFSRNGLAAVSENGKQFGYINASGQYVIEPGFEWAGPFLESDLAPVGIKGKYGYVNQFGKLILEPIYDSASSFGANGLAAIKQLGKYGYIDTHGLVVIEPKFQDAREFARNGLAVVKDEGKYGYINVTGAWAIPAKFDHARTFADSGVAVAGTDTQDGLIDKTGKFVVEHKNKNIESPYANGVYSLGGKNYNRDYFNAYDEIIASSGQDDCGEFYLRDKSGNLLWPYAPKGLCGGFNDYSPPLQGAISYVRIIDTQSPRTTGSVIFDSERCDKPEYIPPSAELIAVPAGRPLVIAPVFDGKFRDGAVWKCNVAVSFEPKVGRLYEINTLVAFGCAAVVLSLNAKAERVMNPFGTLRMGQRFESPLTPPFKTVEFDARGSRGSPFCDFESANWRGQSP